MTRGTWERLAEAVGIEAEAGPNWAALAKRRSMQRYGSTDRRDKQGPMTYFNSRGTGSAQRQDTMAAMTPDMTGNPNGGINVPGPQDRPGQGNPLFDRPRGGLATAPNAPRRPSLGGMMLPGDDEDEGLDY